MNAVRVLEVMGVVLHGFCLLALLSARILGTETARYCCYGLATLAGACITVGPLVWKTIDFDKMDVNVGWAWISTLLSGVATFVGYLTIMVYPFYNRYIKIRGGQVICVTKLGIGRTVRRPGVYVTNSFVHARSG